MGPPGGRQEIHRPPDAGETVDPVAQKAGGMRSHKTRPCWHRARACLALVVAVAGEACLLAQATRGEGDWTGFRGSAGNGVAENAELPIRWGPREGLRWKTQLPGTGWSQPIVWGNRIFVTTAETEHQQKPRPGDWGPGFSLFGGLGRRVFAPAMPTVVSSLAPSRSLLQIALSISRTLKQAGPSLAVCPSVGLVAANRRT